MAMKHSTELGWNFNQEPIDAKVPIDAKNANSKTKPYLILKVYGWT